MMEVIFIWATPCTKVSVLLFYRRVADGTLSRRFKWMTIGAIAFVILYTSVVFILMLLSCHPLDALWNRLDPNYNVDFHCSSVQESGEVAILSRTLSVVTDVYSVLLPAYLLMQIRIGERQRVGLVIVFGIGGLYAANLTRVLNFMKC